tara:strand:- start:3142 stop:3498 length:357 start_codon:yes stop_codon:yes gene_type:complete
MGDRALVLFKDARCVSPTVYLHWDGNAVPTLVEQLGILMNGRHNDASYAAARFIGIVHEHTPGSLSLGVVDTPDEISDAVRDADEAILARYSHGDAGVVVVDTSDFSWKAFGGYLEDC